MKVWIDCSNSPHPLLFAPVARALEERGHEVAVTVRDHAQTVELARQRWPTAEIVDGRRPAAARVATAVELATRTASLRRWARRAQPDVALSHNSYAQLAAARSARIPAVTAMDYEHQPANHLAFRLAQRILLPAALPAEVVGRQGARPPKVRRYEGLKEELYLGELEHDAGIREKLGIAPDALLVVARTAATRAAYHGRGDGLFAEAVARLARRPDLTLVVLWRHPEHRRELEALAGPNVLLPPRAVDALSLVREADLFLGAGGTMTREAALLGTPALSVFAGRQPAVDRLLESRGLLRRLEAAREVDTVRARAAPPAPADALRERSRALVELFVAETLAAAPRGAEAGP